MDTHADKVVRTIYGLPGVLAVPALHRVYATASDANQVATIDETTGKVLHRGPTGDTPDGLAYDPVHHTVWTTNESGGSETVVDATTGAARGTLSLPGCDHDHGLTLDPADRLAFATTPPPTTSTSPRSPAGSPPPTPTTGTSPSPAAPTSPTAPMSSPSTPPPTSATTLSRTAPADTRLSSCTGREHDPSDGTSEIGVTMVAW
ncbi:YncE family protein [Streptomyces sp. NPDC020192]|uniref:YncE family protein n=1 Tax=Streptomyces sp. NPDC020192 TaxID=3365066 RepID=UPI003790C87D